ncbi:hypothetical protein ES703_43471 [subsurface metagenome]
MGIALGGGLSRGQHAAIPHTLAMLADVAIVASDYLQNEIVNVDARNSTEYEKVRDMTLDGVGGTLKIYFRMKTENAGATAYGRIYRNGTPVGTERSTSETEWQEYTEDISGWSDGDKIGFYVKTSNATYHVATSDRRVSGDVVPSPDVVSGTW